MNQPRGALRRAVLAAAAAAAVATVALTPTLGAGPGGADLHRISVRGVAYDESTTVPRAVTQMLHTEDRERGGWFPLADAVGAAWGSGLTLREARMLQLVVTVGAVAAMAVLAALLFGSVTLGAAAGLGMVLALQLRLGHDPVLGTTLGTSLCVLALIIAAIFALFFHARPAVAAGGAALFSAAAVGSDPLGYAGAITVAATAIIAAPRRWPVTVAVIAVAAIAAAIGLFRGEGFAHAYSDAFALAAADGSRFVRDAVLQMFAALPTSYRSAGGLLQDGATGFWTDERFRAIPPLHALEKIAVVLTGAIMFSACMRRAAAPNLRVPSVIALAWWIVPAGVREPGAWPHGMPAGHAFDAVLLQTAGVGLGLAALAAASGARLARNGSAGAGAAIAVALAAAIVLDGNLRYDRYVVDRAIAHDGFRRDIVAAADNGLFAALRDGATIAIDADPAWLAGFGDAAAGARFVLAQHAGRRLIVRPPVHLGRDGRCRPLERCEHPTAEWLVYRSGNANKHSIVLARWNDSAGSQPETRQTRIYTRYADLQSRRRDLIAFIRSGRGFVSQAEQRGTDGLLATWARRCGPVPMRRAALPDGPTTRFGAGFYPPSRSESYQLVRGGQLPVTYTETDRAWRYAGSEAVIEVLPDACEPGTIRVLANVYTGNPADIEVRANGASLVRAHTSEAGAAIDVLVPSDGRPFTVHLRMLGASPIPIGMRGLRDDHSRSRDVRMLVVDPQAQLAG